MSDSLAELFVTLTANTTGFLAGMKEAQAAGERFAASFEAVQAKVKAGFAELGASAEATAVKVKVADDEQITSARKATTARKVAADEQMGLNARLRGSEDALAASRVSTAAGFERTMKSSGLAFAGLAGIVGYESVKMASDFQTQMTRLYTAAGAPKQAVQESTDKILALGNQLGFTGTQMAEALYHPISAGLDMATALNVVRDSAKEAQISGASLDDTTYALSSVMKAFNFNAKDSQQTMASLNAIVGEGDMRFQDFNQSVKNWAPTAAQMGISVNSMGSGLAYLTDRGNSAEVAATRLTMGISMMTTPSAQAGKMLEGLGVASSDVSASSKAMETAMRKAHITQNQLAVDLQKPDGLYVALNHLKTSLEAAGVSGTEADSVLAKIFGGGRSDKAIMSLMQNLDGLKDKYDAITKDSAPQHFEDAWQQASDTFKVQMDRAKASVENLGIKIGGDLMPAVTAIASGFANFTDWLNQNKDAADALAWIIGGVLAIAFGALALKMTAAVLRPTLELAKAGGRFAAWAFDVIARMTGVSDAAKLSATQRELADKETQDSAEKTAAATEEAAAVEQSAAEKTAAVVEESTAKITTAYEDLVVKAKATGEEIGTAISAGVRQGITDGLATAVESARELAEKVILAVKEALGIASPSTKMIEAGINIDQGLAQGIRDDTAAAVEAARLMATEVVAAVDTETALVKPVVVRTVVEGGGAGGAAAAEGAGAAGAAAAARGRGKGIGGKLLGAAGTIFGVGMAAQIGDSVLPANTDAQNANGAHPFSSPQAYTDHSRSELAGMASIMNDPGAAFQQLKDQLNAFPQQFANSPFMHFFQSLGPTVGNGIKQIGPNVNQALSHMASDGVSHAAAWAIGVAGKIAAGVSASKAHAADLRHGVGVHLGAMAGDAAGTMGKFAGNVDAKTSLARAMAKDHAFGIRSDVGNALAGLVVDTSGHAGHFASLIGSHTATARAVAKDRAFGIKNDVGVGLGGMVTDTAGHMGRFTGAVDKGVTGATSRTGQFPGQARASMGDTGTLLYNAGTSILQGLLNGLKAAWNNVTGFIAGIGPWIAAHKGPIEYDRTLLTPHGHAIMAGLHDGLAAGHDRVRALIGRIGGDIRGELGGSRGLNLAVNGSGVSIASASALTAGAGGGSVIVHVTVNGSVLTEHDLAQTIQRVVLQHGVRNSSSGLVYGFG